MRANTIRRRLPGDPSTASEWAAWADARRREADAVRARVLREADDAEAAIERLSCSECEVRIDVPGKVGSPRAFAKAVLTHEMTCSRA